MNNLPQKFPIGRALTSLTLLFVGGLLITALLTGLVIDRLDTIPALQISIIAQNVLTFTMPAVVAVCIYTAKPWRFLAIDRRPPIVDIALMTAVYVASIPLVNYLVALNEAIALPECLSVWIADLIFSFFHFQFYGLIPRTVIGAVLGYALIYSRNIWVPVIGHAANNAVAALLQAFHVDEQNLIPGTAADSIPILPLLSLAACVAIIIGWHRRASHRPAIPRSAAAA